MKPSPSKIININPRDYQNKIFETAKNQNTLVVLPTGLGKTLIALMLAVDRKYLFPQSKILFLAPTRPLIEQHFHYFKFHLPELFADLQLFTGSIQANKRKEIWQTAEIIFSTPQCVANDIASNLYDLKDISLLVVDEAHRCLKNYDYTKVVSHYKKQSQNQRILGLTASPGHDPEKIKQICEHLNIEEIELRSRDSDDVKKYLQSLDFEKIEVPFPKEFEELRILLKRLWYNNVDKIRAIFPNLSPINKITLLSLQKNLSFQITKGNHAAYSGISMIAQAIKISHALELLETQTLSGLRNYLNSLIKQAQEKKSKAVQSLVKSAEFNAALISLEHLLSKHQEHPKIEMTSSIIKKQFSEKENSKVIIFTQFRETAQIIVKSLSSLPAIKASVFIGQAKKTLTGGMSQKEQREIIEKFKTGEINILVATSIGEEGLDIPEVNVVIFYEPIPSAIRKIQRAGRTARLAPGKLIILVTQDTRDVSHHYASGARERKMHRSIQTIKEELKLKKDLEQKGEQENAKIKTLDEFK